MAKVSGKIFDLKLFGKLMAFIKPFKATYYFVMFAAILLSVSSTLTPYLLKVTVDDYITPRDYTGMQLFVGLMLADVVAGGALSVSFCLLCQLARTKGH